MKIVGLVFLITYLYFFFTGKFRWNGELTNDIGKKILGSLIFAFVSSVIVGFPLWGIVALIKSIIF